MQRIAITIAATDSCGGAGIEADLKAFSYLGVSGISIPTAFISQTPDKVLYSKALPVDLIEEHLKHAISIKPDVIKIGVIHDEEIAKCISDIISDAKVEKVIIDPVFKASDGTPLFSGNYRKTYANLLLPISYLITPNAIEARELTGIEVKDEKSAKESSLKLLELGARYVLIKGGHIDTSSATDFLGGKKLWKRFYAPRIEGRFHGTGCAFSSLIAANLALGCSIEKAIDRSKRVLFAMMLESFRMKKFRTKLLNFSPPRVSLPPSLEKKKFEVWLKLNEAIRKLPDVLDPHLIPEVGINFGFALSRAKNVDDICAIDGRIHKLEEIPNRRLKFGASEHVARIILTVMQFDSDMRSALNLAYSDGLVERLKKSSLKVVEFDRRKEPKESKSTMEWGTKIAVKKLGEVPDVVIDRGGVGKEPMVRVIGRDPMDVIKKIANPIDLNKPLRIF